MAGRENETNISIQILADEVVKGHPGSFTKAPQSTDKCLSALDQTCLGYSSFGGQVLFRTSVVAPVLKQAFAHALTELPWFAGRLVLREDGRTYDIDCNNAGGRIIFASTSATLAQLEEALSPSAPTIFAPTDPYALPYNVDEIVDEKLPLCLVYLLHLSGGGALLVIRISHSLVDFTGLQTFVDHMATAYNTALALAPARDAAGRANSGVGRGASDTPAARTSAAGGGRAQAEAAAAAAAAAAACRQELLSQPGHTPRPGFYAPEAVDAIAEALSLPPGAKHRERVVAVVSERKALFAFLGILKSMLKSTSTLFRGVDGVETRVMSVPAPRLAELKRRCTEEIKKDTPSAWVSTRDCLAARLTQLLHAVPLKRGGSTFFLVLADLRPRAVPHLPDGQLGNWVWGARVDEVAPCRMGLGELAARVRAALDRLPYDFSDHLKHLRGVVASHPARALVSEIMFDPDPYRCYLTPEGPVMINAWAVQYDVWQFGPEPPLAFTPALPPGFSPNLVLSYPAAPPGPGSSRSDGTDRGLVLHVSLHRSVWRQLDAATGGDLAAAL